MKGTRREQGGAVLLWYLFSDYADTAGYAGIGPEPDNWYEHTAEIIKEKFAINTVVRVFFFLLAPSSKPLTT